MSISLLKKTEQEKMSKFGMKKVLGLISKERTLQRIYDDV